MFLNDKIFLARKTIIKNKRDWIQILIFTLLLLFLLGYLTYFFTQQNFVKIMTEDAIAAHRIYVTVPDGDEEVYKKIRNLPNVDAFLNEYEVYIRAQIKEQPLEFYSVPSNMDFAGAEIQNLQAGQMIASNYLELIIDGKTVKGQQLIGKKVTISVGGEEACEVEIVGIVDATNFSLSNNAAFLSHDDMLTIGDVQESLLDEFTTIQGVYVVMTNDAKNVDSIREQAEEIGAMTHTPITVDYEGLAKIYQSIFTQLVIGAFLYLFVRLSYLYIYFLKEKKNIMIFLMNGYRYGQIPSIYSIKNVISSLITIVLAFIFYWIGVAIFIWTHPYDIAMGFMPTLPILIFGIMFILEVVINFVLTKIFLLASRGYKVSDVK